MARMAVETGVTDIVATPHANHRYTFDHALVDSKISQLSAALEQSSAAPGLRLHRGCELHLTPDNVRDALACPAMFSIAGKGYLLLEFSDHAIPESSSEILRKMLAGGVRPIIVHPERNPILRDRLELVEIWVDFGCYVQVTAQSVLGRFGKSAKETADRLLRNALVHFLASDAHDCKHRPPSLDSTWKHISKDLGERVARALLETNPANALAGGRVDRVRVDPRKKFFLL